MPAAAAAKPISFACAKAVVNRTLVDGPCFHARTQEVYGGRPPLIPKDMARRDAVLLAQLRSGHCTKLGAYRALLDSSVDPTCPDCGMAPQTVEHWLADCPQTTALRYSLFGTAGPPLTVLRDQPREVVLLARRTIAAAVHQA